MAGLEIKHLIQVGGVAQVDDCVDTNRPDRCALRLTSPQVSNATNRKAMPSAEAVTTENDRDLLIAAKSG